MPGTFKLHLSMKKVLIVWNFNVVGNHKNRLLCKSWCFCYLQAKQESSGMSVGISGRVKTFLFGNLFLDVFFPLNSDKLSQRRPMFAVSYREISEYIITRWQVWFQCVLIKFSIIFSVGNRKIYQIFIKGGEFLLRRQHNVFYSLECNYVSASTATRHFTIGLSLKDACIP